MMEKSSHGGRWNAKIKREAITDNNLTPSPNPLPLPISGGSIAHKFVYICSLIPSSYTHKYYGIHNSLTHSHTLVPFYYICIFVLLLLIFIFFLFPSLLLNNLLLLFGLEKLQNLSSSFSHALGDGPSL